MIEQIVTLASLSVDGKGSYGIGASAVPFSTELYTYLRITDINDDGTLNKNDLKWINWNSRTKEYNISNENIS